MPTLTYIPEHHRAEQKVISLYDPNVTGDDPFPAGPELRSGDPILGASRGPLTAAYIDLVTNQIGYRTEGPSPMAWTIRRDSAAAF